MRLTKTLTLAALGSIALAGPAQADRRTGMGGNVLIEDRDDIFLFPQLVLKYKNMVGFDYAGSQGQGNAVLTFGQGKTAFGFIVNRVDASTPIGAGMYGLDYELNQNSGMAQPLLGGRGTNTAPSTIVDFLFGTKMGNKNLGFRVALGHGGVSGPNPGDGDKTDANGTTVIRVGGGISLPGSKMRGDLGFDLGLAFGNEQIENDGSASDLAFAFGANARFYNKMTDNMDLGILGSIGLSTRSSTNTSDGAKNDAATELNVNILGGFGPVFRSGNSTVAGYGIVGLQMQQNDPSTETDKDASSTNEIWLPGFRIAFEHEIFEWLYFRSGTEYTWRILSSSPESGNGSMAGGQANRAGTFGWNSGLGVKVGNFRFDGAFNHNYLTTGPDFLGGAGGGMFVQSSATYTW